MQVVRLNPQSGVGVPVVTPVDPAFSGAVVAVGNFDGLHLGHQALFAAVRDLAGHLGGLPTGVVTFEPHPVRVLAPQLAPPLILRDDEKAAGLAALGLDVTYVVPFTPALASLSPREFCQQVLADGLHVGGVVVGEGFKFGARAAGRLADLQAIFADRAIEVPSVRVGGYVCSSSKIRELILQGHVEAAATLLGHPYFVEGVVVRGDGRGRTIGIPTANIDSQRELLPRVGVYATRVVLDDGRVIASVTNVGLRPTFQGEGVRVEAHLFDFDGDLYGRRVRLDVLARLRDEKRFNGIDALVAQIHEDVAAAKAILAPADGTDRPW
jgi:riboflavin kinase/FMN adenylyltransferase